MKKLIFSFVIFSILFIIGCQENSITDPVQEDLLKNDDPLVHQGTMKLEGDLADPRAIFNDNFKHLTIFGDVKFEHRFEYLQDNSTTPQKKVYLNLSMNAEIQDRNSTIDIIWSLSGESKDIIDFFDGKTYNNTLDDLNKTAPQKILYKYYSVHGSDVGMRLVCRFIITTNGVSLSNYSLQLQRTDGSYPEMSIN